MSVMTCPKCQVIWPADKPLPITDCPACGVVFSKFHAAQAQKKAQAAAQAERDSQAERKRVEAAVSAERKAAAAQAVPQEERNPNLAACAACGGKVARGAKTCPHCGAPGPAKPTSSVKFIAYGLGVFLIVGFLARGGEGSSAPPRGAATEEQRALAQAAIRSANYRCDDVEYMGPLLSKPGFRVTCNGSRYAYEWVDEGGRWTVRLD
jgi:hypothetical protein